MCKILTILLLVGTIDKLVNIDQFDMTKCVKYFNAEKGEL